VALVTFPPASVLVAERAADERPSVHLVGEPGEETVLVKIRPVRTTVAFF
jgi:hypothetical protein